MSNSFKEVDMKNHIKYNEIIFNQAPLNTCIGCIHRGSCEVEIYTEVGSYCRNKQVISEVVNAR